MPEETIFQEALARPPQERAAFLDQACAGRPELRQAVEALLEAHQKTGNILDQPPIDPARTLDSPTSPPHADVTIDHTPRPEPRGPDTRTAERPPSSDEGLRIGDRYVLQEKIGEGGMGEVWVAKQSQPVKRRVALKLIRPGMDSRGVLQRFEQERQALALMDHPHIAKVLDGGLTPTGQPYFVMELVNGLPLTRFCDETRLSPRERLELFVPICQAVQHAHQKGIVHRDLKPANILVTILDGKPVPKVIDFGVAKATAGKLTDETLSTHFGAVVGTLEYMSPEQAGYSGDDVDTRADIYSLGVILYELLTGLRPIDARKLRKAALTEMVRLIQEEEPSKPSTRLSTEDALPALAAMRQTEPRRLMALLRGELDWVVMKCLEKSRDRRYETANALARDVQRFLADEPVEARPPSASYRARKFLRRHKGEAIAAGLVFVALLGGLVGTSFGLFQADAARRAEARQRGIAQVNATKAIAAANEEARARAVAEKRLTQVEKGVEVLGSIFEELDPEARRRTDKPLQEELGERLDHAAETLRGDAVADPLVVADLRLRLGKSHLGLGNNDQAIRLIGEVRDEFVNRLGKDDARTRRAEHALGVSFLKAGKHRDATALFEDLLARETKDDPDGPAAREVAEALAASHSEAGEYDRALALMEMTLEKARRASGPSDVSGLVHNLAMTYERAGKVRQAIPLHEEALRLRRGAMGDRHLATLTALQSLAEARITLGEHATAVPLLEEAYRLFLETQGPRHPDTLRALNGLAATYAELGDHARAVPLLEQVLADVRLRLGPDHPNTLTILSNLAQAYRLLKKEDRALPLAEEAYQRKAATLGPDHPDTLATMNSLAAIYLTLRKREEALPLLRKSLDAMRAKLGPDHPETFPIENNLGALHYQTGRYREAVTIFEGLLGKARRFLGDVHPNTLFVAFNLIVNQAESGDVARAEKDLEEWLPRCVATLPPAHPATKLGQGTAARVRELAGKAGEGEAYRRSQVEEARETVGAGSPAHADALVALARNLLLQKKGAEAEAPAREALGARQANPANEAAIAQARALVGLALLGQSKHQEAEPFLVQAHDALKIAQGPMAPTIRARLIDVLDGLVRLHEETDRSDTAAPWREELARLRALDRAERDRP